MFRFLYDGIHERCFTHPGDRFQDEFLEVNLPDGTTGLEKVGQIDLWELHQQDKDSVDLTTIVARYQSGDINALDSGRTPLFYDSTIIPNDPVLAAQLVRDLRFKYGDLGVFLAKVDSASQPSSSSSEDQSVDSFADSDSCVDVNKEVSK